MRATTDSARGISYSGLRATLSQRRRGVPWRMWRRLSSRTPLRHGRRQPLARRGRPPGTDFDPTRSHKDQPPDGPGLRRLRITRSLPRRPGYMNFPSPRPGRAARADFRPRRLDAVAGVEVQTDELGYGRSGASALLVIQPHGGTGPSSAPWSPQRRSAAASSPRGPLGEEKGFVGVGDPSRRRTSTTTTRAQVSRRLSPERIKESPPPGERSGYGGG